MEQEVRREERQHGLTDSVVELFNCPNLNKNGRGLLRVPGLAALKIWSFRDGSRTLFVPGAWRWL